MKQNRPSRPATSSHRSGTSRQIPSDSLAAAIRDAAQVVERVLAGENLTRIWTECTTLYTEWTPAQRGAVRDLSWNALRQGGRGDFILSRLLRKPLPDSARAILLVALSRLEARPEQAHLIVDQTVDVVAVGAPGLKGVANAVLRNRIRDRDDIDRAISDDPVARWRHPAWWIERVRNDHPDDWERILENGNTHPPMCLRVNRRRATLEAILGELDAAGIAATRVSEDGIRLERPLPVATLPGYADGRLSVQDEGAQQAALLLGARDGERILDACAAPGGKTAHILERVTAGVLALDIDARRLQTVSQNLSRLGLDANMRVADAARPDLWWDGRPFDRILADVPCSASGVVRRHPDIKWHRRCEDISAFAATQASLLDALWQTLAVGGTMLYATCSVFEEENGAQIRAFCARHGNVERLPLHGREEIQLLPDAGHDGFYYAALRKRG